MTSILFLWAVGGAAASADGNALTVTRFLATARDDSHIKTLGAELGSSSHQKPGRSLVEKVEIRAQTQGLEIDKQRYEARVYPKSWSQTEIDKRLSETLGKSFEVTRESLFGRALRQRYDIFLANFEHLGMHELHQEWLAARQDRLRVLRRKLDLGQTDVADLMQAQNRYIELEFKTLAIADRLSEARDHIQAVTGASHFLVINGDELVSVDDIRQRLGHLDASAVGTNASVLRLQVDASLARLRLQRAIAEKEGILRFFTVRYDTDDFERPRKAISIGLSMNVPFLTDTGDEIERRRLQYLQRKRDVEEQRRQANHDKRSSKRTLHRLFKQHELLASRSLTATAEQALKRHTEMEGSDPLVLLQLKEVVLEGKIRSMQIRIQAMAEYIEFLDRTGVLAQRPLRNHLSKTQETIP